MRQAHDTAAPAQPSSLLTPQSHQERRAAFMARVQKALGHAGPPALTTPRPVLVDALVRQVAADDPNRVARFIERAGKNGITVREATPLATLPILDEFLAPYPVERILINAGAWEAQLGLREHFTATGKTVIRWGDVNCSADAFHCQAAITDCRFGLADTGAFLVASSPAFGRSSTLTPPVHIVLLPRAQILADMVDGLAAIARESAPLLPSNVVIINGPSKTSDIESNLVTGVHGPKYVYAVVLDG